MNIIPCRAERSAVFNFLYIDQMRVSVLNPVYCKGKLLSWGPINAVMFGYRSKSRGVTFKRVFSRITVGLMTYPVTGSWPR